MHKFGVIALIPVLATQLPVMAQVSHAAPKALARPVLSIPKVSEADAARRRSDIEMPLKAFEVGIFGRKPGDLYFVAEPKNDTITIWMRDQKQVYLKQPDGTYRWQAYNLHLVDMNTIDISGGGAVPGHYIRTGKAEQWSAVMTQFYNEKSRWYEQQTAAINAQIAAQQSTNSNLDPEPTPSMSGAFLGEIQAMAGQVQQQNQQRQAEFDRRIQRDTRSTQRLDYAAAGSGRSTAPPPMPSSTPIVPRNSTMGASATAPSERKLTMFCFAFGSNNLVQYKSQRGSRNVSINAQAAWQDAMKQEFAKVSGAPLSSVFCHYNETGEQFNAEPQAINDNASLIRWSPH